MGDPVIPPPEQIKADVEHLKDWLSKEPHLAHLSTAENEEWLETFLFNNKFSLEKTKYKLENLYSLRSKYPEIFKNRDPTGEDLLQFNKIYKLVFGHKPTKDGRLVVQCKLEGDPENFQPEAYQKKLFMIIDMAISDKRNRLANSITIVDCKDTKPGHMLKFMPIMGTLAEITEAYTQRSKAIHVINLPSFAQKFLETAIKLLLGKLNRRLHIHGEINTLFEAVDEDVVCSDFGGKGPSLAELEEQMQKKLEEAREWFKNQGNLCSNEELRTKDSKQAQEMKGSFRKLDVD